MMGWSRAWLLAAVAVTGLGVAQGARGSVIMLTSAASYAAASFPTVSIEFDGLTDPSSFASFGSNPGSLSVGAVAFTAPADSLFVMGPGFSGFNFPGDGTATLFAQEGIANSASVLNVDLSGTGHSVTAAGTQIGGFGVPELLTIGVTTNLSTYQFSYAAPNAATGLGFVGFVTTPGQPAETISGISFSAPPIDVNTLSNEVLDNFTYGSVNPAGIPEPASGLLCALGGAGLLARRRRRARRGSRA